MPRTHPHVLQTLTAYPRLPLGIAFFPACYRAVNTILKNILTFGAINFVAFLVVFMVKLVVALAVATIAFKWTEVSLNHLDS